MFYARGSKLACTVLFAVVLTPLALMVYGLAAGVADIVKERKNKEKQ